MNPLLPDEKIVRVGLLAVAPNDNMLSNVGQAAWERSGALEIEGTLPVDEYTIVRPLVIHGGNRQEVEQLLRDWCDAPNVTARCDLILTLGGDGPSPRDVIPDATIAVIERPCPGIAEHLRRFGEPTNAELASQGILTPASNEDRFLPPALTRGVAGIRGQTLIVNLPSCYRKPADALRAVLPLLPEALTALTKQVESVAGNLSQPM
jgi:molybdopterin biosynthesis enzyme MoaB